MQYQVENLKIWQISLMFVTKVYQLTKDFPKEEQYGLTGQMRRAAISIPANVAEGKGRGHQKEYLQFLYIAKGSALELLTLVHVAKNLEYLSNELVPELLNDLSEIIAMLSGLIRSLQ